ncbi:MAG: hypothetical protein KF744_07375 [Taibaiella sp.]|nr:hypothetical protein [Taibaiella sp.]
MRLLCTLLAFLVLTLSVQPVCAAEAGRSCCTEESCCVDEEAGSDHQQHSCSSGCNPFQVCACCPAGVVLPGIIYVVAAPLLQPVAVAWGIFSPQSPVWPAYAIWQPPKILTA